MLLGNIPHDPRASSPAVARLRTLTALSVEAEDALAAAMARWRMVKNRRELVGERQEQRAPGHCEGQHSDRHERRRHRSGRERGPVTQRLELLRVVDLGDQEDRRQYQRARRRQRAHSWPVRRPSRRIRGRAPEPVS